MIVLELNTICMQNTIFQGAVPERSRFVSQNPPKKPRNMTLKKRQNPRLLTKYEVRGIKAAVEKLRGAKCQILDLSRRKRAIAMAKAVLAADKRRRKSPRNVGLSTVANHAGISMSTLRRWEERVRKRNGRPIQEILLRKAGRPSRTAGATARARQAAPDPIKLIRKPKSLALAYDGKEIEGYRLNDAQWSRVCNLAYSKTRQKSMPGRPTCNPRRVLEAILWKLKTGTPWRKLTPAFGVSAQTSHRYFRLWDIEMITRRLADEGADLAPSSELPLESPTGEMGG